MFRLCCTRKVLRRLRTDASTDASLSTNVLGDWFVDVSDFIDGRPMFLFVNAKTRLPILANALSREEPARVLLRRLEEVLDALGFPRATIAHELRLMGQSLLVKTDSRSVLGSMNDFWGAAEAHWTPDSFLETSIWLGNTLCGPLRYNTPIEVTRSILV